MTASPIYSALNHACVYIYIYIYIYICSGVSEKIVAFTAALYSKTRAPRRTHTYNTYIHTRASEPVIYAHLLARAGVSEGERASALEVRAKLSLCLRESLSLSRRYYTTVVPVASFLIRGVAHLLTRARARALFSLLSIRVYVRTYALSCGAMQSPKWQVTRGRQLAAGSERERKRAIPRESNEMPKPRARLKFRRVIIFRSRVRTRSMKLLTESGAY